MQHKISLIRHKKAFCSLLFAIAVLHLLSAVYKRFLLDYILQLLYYIGQMLAYKTFCACCFIVVVLHLSNVVLQKLFARLHFAIVASICLMLIVTTFCNMTFCNCRTTSVLCTLNRQAVMLIFLFVMINSSIADFFIAKQSKVGLLLFFLIQY